MRGCQGGPKDKALATPFLRKRPWQGEVGEAPTHAEVPRSKIGCCPAVLPSHVECREGPLEPPEWRRVGLSSGT